MAKSFKERFHEARAALARRGRGHAATIPNRMMTLGKGTAVGAASALAGREIRKRVTFLGERWWGEGAAILGVSYFFANKYPSYAMAGAGAAGYSLWWMYQINEYLNGRLSTAPYPVFKVGGTSTTSGIEEDAVSF